MSVVEIIDKRPTHRSQRQTTDTSLEDTSSTPRPAASLINQLSFSVTGPPSRHHWKSDSEVERCEYENCATSFGFFERRHYCRQCGDIFCTQHCSSYFRLDQDCQFHQDGMLSRGCDPCTAEYHAWTKIVNNLEQPQQYGHTLPKQSSSLLPATTPSPPLLQKQSSPKKRPSISKRDLGVKQQPQAMETRNGFDKKDDQISEIEETPRTKNISIKNSNNKNKSNNDPAFNPAPSVPTDWQWSTF
ncbi:unnamed protein product [Absidia cylindrospora]